MRLQNAVVEQLPVYAKIDSFLGPTLAHMHRQAAIQRRFFGFSQSLLLQKMLIPGRNHHFETVRVETLQVLVQSPAESAVSQVNKANLAHYPDEIAALLTIDFELGGDRNRAVVRPRHMSQTVMDMSADRRRLEIEIRYKVDRKRYRQQQAEQQRTGRDQHRLTDPQGTGAVPPNNAAQRQRALRSHNYHRVHSSTRPRRHRPLTGYP